MEANLELKPEVKKSEPDKVILKPGELVVTIEMIVRDKEGRVTERREQQSKSFLRQFLDLLILQGSQVPVLHPMKVKDTSDNDVDVHASGKTLAADAPDSDTLVEGTNYGDVYGIQVGKGTTAPTITDCVLETKIARDDGTHPADTMHYGGMTFGAPTSDGTTSHFTCTRDLANQTAGTITVNEIGLVVLAITWDTKIVDLIQYYILIIRDVITDGIAVPAGQTLTINYREQASI